MPRFRAPRRTLPGAAAFPLGHPRLPGRHRCLALALVLGPLLGGCTTNPIAQQLAASFDSPAPSPPGAGSPAAVTSPAAQGQAGANPAVGIGAATPLIPPSGNPSTTSPSPGTAAKPDQKGSSTASVTAGAAAGPGAKPSPKGNALGATPDSTSAQAPAKSRAATPAPAAAPYRVTIKLPGADPSAPAELVTRALRAAGVSFEVETIERIGSGRDAGSRPAAPRSTPAPAER